MRNNQVRRPNRKRTLQKENRFRFSGFTQRRLTSRTLSFPNGSVLVQPSGSDGVDPYSGVLPYVTWASPGRRSRLHRLLDPLSSLRRRHRGWGPRAVATPTLSEQSLKGPTLFLFGQSRIGLKSTKSGL